MRGLGQIQRLPSELSPGVYRLRLRYENVPLDRPMLTDLGLDRWRNTFRTAFRDQGLDAMPQSLRLISVTPHVPGVVSWLPDWISYGLVDVTGTDVEFDLVIDLRGEAAPYGPELPPGFEGLGIAWALVIPIAKIVLALAVVSSVLFYPEPVVAFIEKIGETAGKVAGGVGTGVGRGLAGAAKGWWWLIALAAGAYFLVGPEKLKAFAGRFRKTNPRRRRPRRR